MTTNGTATKSKRSYSSQEVKRILMTVNALYQSRAALASQLGKQYDGDRDIYKQAGYPQDVTFDKYDAKYTRQDIAGRIVDAPAQATWQTPPIIKDGDLGDTPFIQTWNKLVNFNRPLASIDDQKSVWHYLERIDKMSGIGHYGVLLVGINDGRSLDQPLAKAIELANSNMPPAQFIYLSPYDEGNAEVAEIFKDHKSSRFNLPESYKLNTSGDIVGASVEFATINTPVHWSRVIHVAEGLRNNEVFGTPRLEGVYNLLEDLLKVTAGSGEAAWRLMNKGIIASTRDNIELPDDEDEFEPAIESYLHGLTRYLELQGVDVTVEGGEIVDPTGNIKSIISLISAETGIPQRILLGSEAGQLASSQDERNWMQRIQSRQSNFAEPVLIRPLISRLIWCGILPPPTSGSYQVSWSNLMTLNDFEEADMRNKDAGSLSSAVGPDKLPLETYLREFLKWSGDQIQEMREDRKREATLQSQIENGMYSEWFDR